MASNEAPSSPRLFGQIVDRSGRLTQDGQTFLEGLWRQVVAGYVVVPCSADTDTNVITLSPILHQEGGATYADHMPFSFVADEDTTGPVSIGVGSLPPVKAYVDGGATQADSGDILANRLYLVLYNSALDGGAGGLVVVNP